MSKHPIVEAYALTRFKAGGKVYPEGPCKVPAALAEDLAEAGLIALAANIAEKAAAEAKAEAERVAAEAAAKAEAEKAAAEAAAKPKKGGGKADG